MLYMTLKSLRMRNHCKKVIKVLVFTVTVKKPSVFDICTQEVEDALRSRAQKKTRLLNWTFYLLDLCLCTMLGVLEQRSRSFFKLF